MRQKARLAQEQAAQGRRSLRENFSSPKDFKKGEKGDHSGSDRCCSLPGFLYAEKRSYHSYKVLNTSEQEDVVVHTVCGHGWRYPEIQSGWSICCGQQHEYDLE